MPPKEQPKNRPDPKIALLILAAGQASRMGEPKQLLQIDGQSLIRRIAEQCLSTSHRPVVAVLGAHFEAIQKEVENLSVEIVRNEEWAQGIGSSIAKGVTFIEENYPQIEALLILLCDQPLVDAEVLHRLVGVYEVMPEPIVTCLYAGEYGVPTLFDRSYFPKLKELSADHGAKKIMNQNSQDVFSIKFPQGKLDLDTPADYQAFLKKNRK